MGLFDLFGHQDTQKTVQAAPANPQGSALSELETSADKICRALGIDPDAIERRASDESPLPRAVMEPLMGGNKIMAIKIYRELTNCGLKEAKDAIDAVEAGGLPENISHFGTLQAKLDAILARVEAER